MKQVCLFVLLGFIGPFCYSQKNFTLNQGGTNQKEYFSEIAYETIRSKIIVKANINDKTYRFIVDTGAPNVITKRVFDELNPAILKKIPVTDANNITDSLTVVALNEMKLGEIIFNNVPAIVAEKNTFILDCHQVDGLIGSNMLRNTIVRFSPKEQKITLTDQEALLPLNKKQGSKLFLTPGQSSPYFSVEVKGKNEGNIELLFDTGMEGMFDFSLRQYDIVKKKNIFVELAKSQGLGTVGLHGTGKDTSKYLLRIPELKVNGSIFKNVTAETTASGNSRIGVNLLKYGIVTVDYKNKKFYFEPFEGTNDLLESAFPIVITVRENKAVVGTVWDEKLKAEITSGDQLITIDNINYKNVNPCDLLTKTKIFEGKKQATLTVQKVDGALKAVTISRSIP